MVASLRICNAVRLVENGFSYIKRLAYIFGFRKKE